MNFGGNQSLRVRNFNQLETSFSLRLEHLVTRKVVQTENRVLKCFRTISIILQMLRWFRSNSVTNMSMYIIFVLFFTSLFVGNILSDSTYFIKCSAKSSNKSIEPNFKCFVNTYSKLNTTLNIEFVAKRPLNNLMVFRCLSKLEVCVELFCFYYYFRCFMSFVKAKIQKNFCRY